jgi:hypothetical protein
VSVGRWPESARDVNGGSYLQAFLIAAVVAMLGTRFYLTLTGFPRIGGGELHVAHLIWGGLLMMLALVLMLALLGRRTKWLGAVIGGAGFGLFVDELGKFITADNDYFFQPTIALIYVVFVLLFLVFRGIGRHSLSSAELLANAANQVPELVLGGASHSEVARALALLERCEEEGAFADALREAIGGTVCTPDRPPARVVQVMHGAWRTYERLREWPWFERSIVLVFMGQAGLGLLSTLGVAVFDSTLFRAGTAAGDRLAIGASACGLISVGLTLVGVVRLPRSGRLAAYRWFERSVLVSILFTQVILFWQDQLAAIGGLAWNLVLLSVLRFAIHQEEGRRALADLRNPDSRALVSSAA